MSKLLTHIEALEAVYEAISVLRQEGHKKISITQVAKRSGVSRSTIHTKHPDWEEVRDVIINNKPSRKVKLTTINLDEKMKWKRDAEGLTQELNECKENLSSINELAETVYKKLLEELHKYVVLSKETPKSKEKQSKILQELSELQKQIDYYKAENRRLRAEIDCPTNILPLSRKEVINVINERNSLEEADLLELSLDAVNELDDFFSENRAQIPNSVFLLCGNFGSGKSYWISNHSPTSPGLHLYFDGTNHTKNIRKIFIKRLQKLGPQCKVICVRILFDLEQCLERNMSDIRKRTGIVVSKELVSKVDEGFEEVSVDEGFDEIIIVRGT